MKSSLLGFFLQSLICYRFPIITKPNEGKVAGVASRFQESILFLKDVFVSELTTMQNNSLDEDSEGE